MKKQSRLLLSFAILGTVPHFATAASSFSKTGSPAHEIREKKNILPQLQNNILEATQKDDRTALTLALAQAKENLSEPLFQELWASPSLVDYVAKPKQIALIQSLDKQGLIPEEPTLLAKLDALFIKLEVNNQSDDTAPTKIYYIPRNGIKRLSETVSSLLDPTIFKSRKSWAPIDMRNISSFALENLLTLGNTTFQEVALLQKATQGRPLIREESHNFLINIATKAALTKENAEGEDIRALFEAVSFLDIRLPEVLRAIAAAATKWAENAHSSAEEQSTRWAELNTLSPLAKKEIYTMLLFNKKAQLNQDYNKAGSFNVSIQDLIDWNMTSETKKQVSADQFTYNLAHRYIRNLNGLQHLPDADRTVSLSLGGNLIETIDASTFAPFNNLKELFLRNNQIKIIDTAFDDLANLKSLDLSNNKVEVLSPSTVTSLGKLYLLNLRHNPIVHDSAALDLIKEQLPETILLANESADQHQADEQGTYAVRIRSALKRTIENKDTSGIISTLMHAKERLSGDNLQQLINTPAYINYLNEIMNDPKQRAALVTFISQLDQQELLPHNEIFLAILNNQLIKIEVANDRCTESNNKPSITYYLLANHARELSGTLDAFFNANLALAGDSPTAWPKINMKESLSASTMDNISDLIKNFYIAASKPKATLASIAAQAQFKHESSMCVEDIKALFDALDFLAIKSNELLIAAGSATIKWAGKDPDTRWPELNNLQPYAREIIYKDLLEKKKLLPYKPMTSPNRYLTGGPNNKGAFNVSVQELLNWGIIDQSNSKKELPNNNNAYHLQSMFIGNLNGLQSLPDADRTVSINLSDNVIKNFSDVIGIFKDLPLVEQVGLGRNPISAIDSLKRRIRAAAQKITGRKLAFSWK